MESFETVELFRGIKLSTELSTAKVFATRKNRHPRDMPLPLHHRANAWFEEKFGIKYRSEAIFVSGNRVTAHGYAGAKGVVARVLPLGPYRYCWSPSVRDLYQSVKLASGDFEIEDLLASADYREHGLAEASQAGVEVMLYCETYIAIPAGLLRPPSKAPAASIILKS
jgi:hypothetical protein